MKSFRSNIIILAAFFILALVFTFPLILHFGDRVLGGMDANYFVWQNWWFKKAIFELHQSPLSWTDYLYYPDGLRMANGYDGLLPSLLSLPLQFFLSAIVTYNTLALLSYVLAGFFTYRLMGDVTKNKVLAFLGGIIFAFSPYMLARGFAGHANLLTAWTIPLFLSFFFKMERNSSLKYAAAAAGSFALIGLGSWQYLVITSFLLAVLFLYRFLYEWGRRLDNGLKYLRRREYLLFLVLSVCLLLPLAFPFLESVLAGTTTRPALFEYITGSANLLSFLVPPPMATLGGNLGKIVYATFTSFNDFEAAIFPGYLELGFLVYALFQIRRGQAKDPQLKTWVFVAVIFFLLSLGPVLLVANQAFLPLPYAFFILIPLVNLIRVPSRFTVVLTLALAFITVNLLQKCVSKKRTIILAALFIIAERLFLPFDLQEEPNSIFYKDIGRNPGNYALLNLPLFDTGHNNAISNYAQLLHDKRIVGGWGQTRAITDQTVALIKDNVLLEKSTCEGFTEQLGTETIKRQPWTDFRLVLKGENVRYVLLHKQILDQNMCAKYKMFLNNYFDGELIYFEDDGLLVYRVD